MILSINYHYSCIRDEDTELQLHKSDLLQDKQLKIKRKTLACFSSIPRYFNFTKTQTNTTQENLDTNTDDASKILDVISWLAITFTRKWGGPSLSGSIQAATYPRLSKCWWVEDEGGVVVMKKITERVRNSYPRLYFHCSHEKLFSRIVSILTSIFMDCILWTWSCANSRDKGKTLSHGG